MFMMFMRLHFYYFWPFLAMFSGYHFRHFGPRLGGSISLIVGRFLHVYQGTQAPRLWAGKPLWAAKPTTTVLAELRVMPIRAIVTYDGTTKANVDTVQQLAVTLHSRMGGPGAAVTPDS